ncbi:MAG: DNA methyltransferase, partial [Prevotella sp.]|nr:DNA methyltransferase [Prevotella sp.]
NGIVARPRFRSSRQLYIPSNLAIMVCRQLAGDNWHHVSVTQSILANDNEERGLVDDCRVSNKTKERGYFFPLYINVGFADSIFEKNEEIVPNFNKDIYRKIQEGLGETVSPTDLFDYIYAVLHSPSYRKRYEEFLKIDFPRIPYPTDLGEFRRLADIGAQLRRLHLMDGLPTRTGITFPVAGTNEVTLCRYEDSRVYINDTQYFDGVAEHAFQHYIGGYQPAQKWLKDRRDRTLDFDDVRHYERIIYALDATRRLMSLI